MSVKVMNAVFDRFPEGGGLMVLALKLADHAHDDGSHIYPSVQSLAQKTRQSGRTVQRQLDRLVRAGWLILMSETRGGRGITNEYCISPEWLAGEDISLTEKGDILSSSEKGDILTPFQKGDICDEKGDIQSIKGDICDRKGDTAMSPEQSRTKSNSQLTTNTAQEFPSWLPVDAWTAFVAMRKKLRKPMTDHAARLAVDKLVSLRAEGHDPRAVLEQSVFNSWQGLFPVKGDHSEPAHRRPNALPKHYGKSGKL
ncbi:helix-turn-helix domain-containing protein [Chromobacterium haemolyticum]|uniref:helix-turn-helix domain-containing protein n=1 Tax=Chromobacterium haemolyticum TaxID=394935 RepID=UPI0003095A6B|nr:helix-turn-helix domain-containing protein [Chromobacterium haemolyticum]